MNVTPLKTKLFDLYIAFAKVGLMTFGGGYAMIPILQKEVVEKQKWVSDEELMDYYAIGQCTPGIIAVNTATFVGRKLRGTIGAIAATLGIITPSLIIILIISSLISKFSELKLVQSAFSGIRCCVVVLILNAVIKLSKTSIKDKISLGIFLMVFILAAFLDLSPILLVIICASIGIIVKGYMGIK